MPLKIVCIGDVHLGRSPTKIPPACSDEARRGARHALQKAVQLARQIYADAVVFTGDVVDQENAYFEGLSALKQTINDLTAAGIPVVAVAGNHDFDTLRELAEELPALKLLGAHGQWEEWLLERQGRSLLRFVGRSFTQRHWRENPLEGFPTGAATVPTALVLHCDVDVPQSIYGPVSLKEMRALGAQACFLGHIHTPVVLSTSPLVLYPGSLQGMNPGEPGPHGAWVVEWSESGQIRTTQHPLAPLRYEQLEVSLDDAETTAAVRPLIARRVSQWHEALGAERGETKAAALRLIFVGRPKDRMSLQEAVKGLTEDPPWEIDGISYFIERTIWRCQPRISLESLAAAADPAGLLATRLLLLERREPATAYRALLEQAAAKLEKEVLQNQTFSALDAAGPLDEEQLREKLLEAGFLVLDQLLEQKQVPA